MCSGRAGTDSENDADPNAKTPTATASSSSTTNDSENDTANMNSVNSGSSSDSNETNPRDGSAAIPSRRKADRSSKNINSNHDDSNNNSSGRPENLMTNASILSRLVFRWPFPLLKLGLERPLEETDLPEIQPIDTSSRNVNYIDALWKKERERNPDKPSLHRALLVDYLRDIWYVQPAVALAHTAKIMQALALGYLIQSFETDNGEGYQWAAVLVACGIVILFEHHHVFFITWRKGMQARIACVASIYAKSLRLSSTHQDASSSTGTVMNLASNDVERFLMCALFMNYVFWSPIQAVAILVVGVWTLGPAFAAGFALLVFIFVPLQFYLSQRFAYFRSTIASITDRRVTFVSQAIHGARVMKMSGYEWRFLERIQKIRSEEVDQIIKANKLKCWNEASFFMANVVISLVIFVVHVMTGGILTPRDVFTVFTLINILQLEMTKHFALGVMGLSECYVSISRIQKYLEFPELAKVAAQSDDDNKRIIGSADDNDDNDNDESAVLSMDHVTCHWNNVEHHDGKDKKNRNAASADDATTSNLIPALTDATIDFEKGTLTCIIGSVGSGKSAILQAVIGELPPTQGTIRRNYNSLAYASQDPWIMDGTVQENITMGLDYERDWYNMVVEACCLVPDFQQFIDGDQTVVGDRGVQCSGGQRARIGLARALYRDADVLVLDDPLSAVDAKVGRLLFNEAIQSMSVQRGKSVILATHQHQYVHDTKCVLLTDGRVEMVGSYSDCIMASSGKLAAHDVHEAAVDALDDHDDDDTNIDGDDKTDAVAALAGKSDAAPDSLVPTKNNAKSDIELNDDDAAQSSPTTKTEQKENRASGFVKFETFTSYFKAMGGTWICVFMLVIFVFTQGSVLLSIAMMGRWAERDPSEQDDWAVVAPIIGLVSMVAVLSIFRAFLSLRLTIRASQRLHDEMTKSVLRSKIAFFDTNPLGRILNRFSADVGSNDDLLPQTLFDFMVMFFLVVGAIATTITVLPFALVVFPPLVWYFLRVRNIFVTSTRELKRLEGLARSPIFAMLSESLSGVATIRANDSIQYFTKKFQSTHDSHTRAFFSFIAASRWVGFRMDSIMFLLMGFVSFLAVLFSERGWFDIDPAILGLSISMLLQLAGLFQWCIRQSAEVVNQFVSVERVLEFGDLEPEGELEYADDKSLVDKSWPQEASIDVKNMMVRYRPQLPPALDGATFKIANRTRVGIVGRTGSGKSTVVQTLFRLLEAENGSISIDGVDISKVGLHTLRTKISVIPQVPTLFSGCTVRENLDLFGIHSDDAIYKALSDSHLDQVISDLPNGIHSMVAESGSNFSVGQRQLLCLARAILSKNKILILDEATASVDRRTDQLLQESLQKAFHDATILAVAHRLDTVIDYDSILVLGNGKVLEFGTPADLIRSGGTFSQMVEDTGPTMARDLKKVAFATETKGELGE
eukprot:CAMPEP_0119552576 /NCGR_PEP_ID=MMETSP1352-20130426/5521_1 /TAXON_ID=265584 /ORGANISM="Stauroneis constricta, Strain CCMP1120" /LENGTH=1426 /DNA_ID=CAMNT_0007598827 /DNA_START=60 /DNA_END=4340 /DNA_ORIENTATION=+